MKTKNKFLKQLVLVCTSLLFIANSCFSQDGDTTKPKVDNRPVKEPFESAYILNSQTIVVPNAKTLEFMMQHRFGKLNSKDFDLLGLYAPSNIRIGLAYTLTDRIMLGFGTTKNNKLQDVNCKYAILKQTRSGSIPINITYFVDLAIDARGDIYPKFTNRLSYFHTLIFARKFSKSFSLQIAPSYSHFNMVDSLIKWDNICISTSGRIKITDAIGGIFEFNQNLTKQEKSVLNVKPGLSIGIEAMTSAHSFQLFIGSLNGISEAHDVLNTNDFLKKDLLIGFNITRLWNL